MNANLGKTDFTAGEIDDLRARLKTYRDSNKVSWTDLGQLVGVPQGTLSQWVPGTYNGGQIYENMSIPGFVHRFFLALEEREALTAAMPGEPDFQHTPSAGRMLTCLALAQLGDMVMISTTPGCGKTEATRQYQATRNNVFRATATKAKGGVMPMLQAILASMGEKDAKGTPTVLTGKIAAKVSGANALIVIDEAQFLTSQALEELRGIHDETGCGIALVGDHTLPPLVKDHAQLHSRIGARHAQNKPLPGDVAAVAAAWDIRGGAELAYLQQIAARSGGLRTVSKTVRLAVRVAREGGAPLALADLRDAYAQRYPEGA